MLNVYKNILSAQKKIDVCVACCHNASTCWQVSTLKSSPNVLHNSNQITRAKTVSRQQYRVPLCTTQRSIFTTRPLPSFDEEKGKLVYFGTLSTQVKLVKGFSVSTSMLGLFMQPFLFQSAQQLPTALALALGGGVSFFIFLTPVLLHYITKRYVTQIYFKQDVQEFTATTLTFFLGEKDHKFKASDVTVMDVPRLFTTITANSNPLFVDPSLFTDKEAGAHMMGYDKPMEWTIPNKSDKHN